MPRFYASNGGGNGGGGGGKRRGGILHFAGQHSALFFFPLRFYKRRYEYTCRRRKSCTMSRGERADGFWEKEEDGVRILPPHLSRSHSSCCRICSMWCSVPDFCFAFFRRRHILMIPFLLWIEARVQWRSGGNVI